MINDTYFELFDKHRDQPNKIYSRLFEDFSFELLLSSYSFGFKGEDARDVVNDFFLEVILPQKEYKKFLSVATKADSNFEAYFNKCFRNHCINALKRNRRREKEKRQYIKLNCQLFETYHQSFDRSAFIDGILSVLPTRQQMAIRFWMIGFSAKEIAEQLEISSAVKDRKRTARNILYRGILTLKKLFGDDEDFRFNLI